MKFTNIMTGEKVTPKDWQLELKKGDYYIIETECTIYGQILKPKGKKSTGMFWVKAWSVYCPEGEVGLMNICDPTEKITKEDFDTAKQRNWR